MNIFSNDSGIKKIINERQMKYAGRNVKICVAKLCDDATAIGAASLILKVFIEHGESPTYLINADKKERNQEHN